MLNLILQRINYSSKGTFGYIAKATEEGEIPLYTTLEELEKGVEVCIPPGVYTCRRSIFHKFEYETFEVMNVPNRQRILIHKGNTTANTEGCILIGLGWNETGVILSELAFNKFIELTKDFSEFQLIVKPPVSG